jgi:hypothetical protein
VKKPFEQHPDIKTGNCHISDFTGSVESQFSIMSSLKIFSGFPYSSAPEILAGFS